MQRRQILIIAAIACAPVSLTIGASAGSEARCTRIEARIAELRLKLRLGYSAKQGRVYHQKLEALEVERRQLCR